ncbi:hypothetical protein V5O48_012007 [Marasmius crinis-equi]|uniref:Uncharacterized protein n=1 Tax=Marasmius crinis-equi TaxID=585013 RepID=A0ABR3F424_9AGAR
MTSEHRRVYLLAQQRSCSHLAYQLLSSHPAFKATSPRSFAKAYQVGTDSQAPTTDHLTALRMREHGLEAEAAARISYQGTLDDMQMEIADAESKDKRFLTMDHPFYLMSSAFVNAHLGSAADGLEDKPAPLITDRQLDIPVGLRSVPSNLPPRSESNPTLLPDRFFFSFTPILTIRHPAHAIPSNLRAARSVSSEFPEFATAIGTSFRFPRLVFDSFKFRGGGPSPIVMDGGRLVQDPQGQMKKLCKVLGLDESGIRYMWDETIETLGSRESKTAKAFLGTFHGSKGVIADKVSEMEHSLRILKLTYRIQKYNQPVDIQEETKKWAEEWGEDVARTLQEKVAAAMEDYEYLLEYCL